MSVKSGEVRNASDEAGTARIVDTVYEKLRALIVSHELAPGAHLSVPALAERFGVSRSPVREAVNRAVRDGIAVERPRQGASVVHFVAATLLPLFELREALEVAAARLAALRRTDRDVEALQNLLTAQERAIEAGKLDAFVQFDMEMHLAIVNACASEEIQQATRRLFLRLSLALSMRVAPSGPDVAFAEHRAIVAAIRVQDADQAETAARVHLRGAVRRLVQQMDDGRVRKV